MKVKVTQSCLTLCDPMDYRVHGIFQARILERVAFPFSRGSFQPRNQTQISHIAGGFFTSWAMREPRNTGVGSFSLLQGIFLTQESNQDLLHCRQILYLLNYLGSNATHLLEGLMLKLQYFGPLMWRVDPMGKILFLLKDWRQQKAAEDEMVR